MNNIIKLKIYNPKTNRYINDNSLPKHNNLNLDNPLPKQYHNICDLGLISEDKINLLYLELQDLLGEFSDLYSVANNSKLLCALDFSNYNKKRYQTFPNLSLINNIINYCNSKDIHYLHNTRRGGMYLKTVFFHKNNYNLALKLMKILWSYEPKINTNIDYQISLGILLGYKYKNIIYFVKRNYDHIIDENYIKNIKIIIDNMDIDNINFGKNNIIYVKYIENI